MSQSQTVINSVGLEFNEPYGFHDRLTRDFPSQVIIDATEVCNLACTHCAHPAFKVSQHYNAKHLNAELSQKAVDEVATSGRGLCQYMRFTGQGEPLLHPRIFEMVSYAVKNSGTTVTITTNGSLGRGDKLDTLLATGVDLIDISIDADTPETYAKIRVNGDLNVTRANVLQLLRGSQTAGSKTKIVVSYIEQPQNAHETANFEAYWKDQGADYVVVRRLHSNAGALVQLAEQMRSDNAVEQRRPCLYPWERIILNPRGQLAFCPIDWTYDSSVNDYSESTIASTWTGEYYQSLRAAHLANNYSGHSFCGQCPDWKTTRWPHQGRSYANMVEEFKGRE